MQVAVDYSFWRWLSGTGLTGLLVCRVASFCLSTGESLKYFDLLIYFSPPLRCYILHRLVSGLLLKKKKKIKTLLDSLSYNLLVQLVFLEFFFPLSFRTLLSDISRLCLSGPL